ncbi:nitroreductase family deazaflavin-dependent oxidoreductase [Yinghuangia sp. ASG 101]|uniref:nitroreductase family deazaflavin-dependent oxidoreductase n=1 Tax=Yinghuangia sp. ASG 101 TaxID=2896848 RepID=UPI001E40E9B0|nr:nitroreductase family deazaflavin-dependent oxidoreductase [Yinghuangia sp. ASG 101]UGQ11737.1 nitroreductase family deazaflavin-dependent oxidoreductase [Yinghuangia sp. ASG 101]
MSEPGFIKHDVSLRNDEHVAVYRETDGETGYEWNGVPILLLTTTGRTSGEPRTKALIFGRDGDDYLVVASTGGSPRHPAWFLNLMAHPEADIQIKAEHIPVVARAASDEERARLWRIVTGYWPNYDVYQTRTERVIPIVVLSPRKPHDTTA